MGVVYTRASDGSLRPAKTLHVFTEAGLSGDITQFSQMNDPVAAFLSAADAAYTDDNGATVSVIADYETAEGDADRPLGYPLTATSGTLYLQNEGNGNGWSQEVAASDIRNAINNAIPGVVSQYLVKDADGKLLENGRILPTGKVRMVRFFGYVRNCRDLGGWACDGGAVKYGKLFRSGVVASAETWIDPQIAKNIGIRHQIDFRNDEEADYITESTLGAGIRYHRIPIELYYADSINTGSSDFTNLQRIYRTIMEAAIHGEGVIYNCSLGRDRTGTVTFLLLALLGVARSDIDKDYELTGFSAMDTPAYRTGTDYQELASYLSTFGGDTLRDNAAWWFIKAGFGLDELNAFRAAMIDGTPDELTAEDFVATYTVTYNLSGCTSSNGNALAEGGSAYTTNLALASGYRHWTSVTVTMGGVDVTSTVYADGVISIPDVTGNVVIKAVAVKYINQIPISTDTDGSIFNGVGYMRDYRIDSSGGLVEAANNYVTGFIPCKSGDCLRFANMNLYITSSAMTALRLGFYDANHKKVDAPYWSSFLNADGTVISDETLSSIVVPDYETEVAYTRFTTYYIDKASVVTVNEEIG